MRERTGGREASKTIVLDRTTKMGDHKLLYQPFLDERVFLFFFLYKNVELMKTQPSDFEDAIQIAFCCLKLLRATFRQMELYISSTILVFMLLKAIFIRAKDVIRFMYLDYRLIFFYIFLC